MQKNLQGKIVLITGLGRKGGIGSALAKSLAERGANIFCSYLHVSGEKANIQEEFELLRSFGVEVDGVEMDLSKENAAENLFALAVKRFGKVDILLNNAACSEQDDIENLSAESIDRHYFVNVRTPMLLVQEFSKAFQGKDGGRIINLTSGQAVGPLHDELAYVASKAAMDTFMQSAAKPLMKKGITINSVDPGATDTGWMINGLKEEFAAMSPLGRVGTPEDIARLVDFLASEESGYITGQVIHSRGGM